MAFVDTEDVQIHLPVDKLVLSDVPDDVDDAIEYSERIIRGYLSTVFESATLALWVDPASTPTQIRLISGLLTAAKIYRDRFGEDSVDDPAYAQQLYNEAMMYLNRIVEGAIVLDDVDDVSSQIDNTWFLPNDASTDQPKFTMSGRF